MLAKEWNLPARLGHKKQVQPLGGKSGLPPTPPHRCLQLSDKGRLRLNPLLWKIG